MAATVAAADESDNSGRQWQQQLQTIVAAVVAADNYSSGS